MRATALVATALFILMAIPATAETEETDHTGTIRSWAPNYVPLSRSWSSITGTNPYDQSGGFNRGVGDVNGDGFDDVITSAKGAGKHGEVYLIFGRGAGMPNDDLLSVADVKFTGESGCESLGCASGAGDVNGDGFDDILMSDFYYSSGGVSKRGKAYLFFGKADGWASEYSVSQAAASWIGERADDWAGFLTTGVGDVNNDTYDDIIIGSMCYDSVENNDTGKVYLIFGREKGWSNNVILDASFFSYFGEMEEQYMGRPGSVAGVGDMNGDGFDDILFGGFMYTDGDRKYVDRTYLILGKAHGWKKNASISNNCDASFNGYKVGDRSCIVGGRGDINADGFDDILISGYGTNGRNGSVYMFYGKSSGWKQNTSVLDADRIYNCSDGSSLGESITILGDVNLDGFDDIAIGAPELSHINADEGGFS
jgi:FG-GAP repeat protein